MINEIRVNFINLYYNKRVIQKPYYWEAILYLTRDDIIEALNEMRDFESALNDVYSERGYNFRENTGRRNALVSVSQERAIANVLRKKFKSVIEDGAPGKPDIFIDDTQTELECKLTSGSKSKSSKVYSLQTDWETLRNKGSLDYLYIVANKEFDSFCVLFFEGLTPEDFFPPANGSRGKSRMNKGKAMKKVTCLFGNYLNHNENHINKITQDSMKSFENHQKKMRDLWEKLSCYSDVDSNKKHKINKMRTNETSAYRKKLRKFVERREYWEQAPKRYKFIFEKV